MRPRVLLRLSLVLAACVALGACLIRVRQVEVEPVVPLGGGTRVGTPVKAHLLDGSTVLYAAGLTVHSDTLRGRGQRYDLRLRFQGPVDLVPLDSVAGMETFRTGINVPASMALSVPATALGALGVFAGLKAIFGSCPTIYADSAGTPVLEAESFSYSIAPLFETRDVDRLGVRPDARGEVRLEVRNEALETHYLNHLELLEVEHAADETVLPDAGMLPLAVRGLRAPASAVDRSGRDVRPVVDVADGRAYETAAALLASVDARDMRDHLDLVFPAPAGADSAAVVLRLRNSLLTTILLYDVMLAAQGARALDWLGSEIGKVGSVLELGQWYNRHMGLRISVWEDGAYRQVARIGDTGPIAWKEVAAVVPVPPGDSLRVRLSFVADAWRIDRVALAAGVRRPEARAIPAGRATNADGEPEPAALLHLRSPDEQYLQTTPGQRFILHFPTGAGEARGPRTYLLASQGYYSEWIRPDWVRTAAEARPFRPTDEMLLEAIGRWRSRKEPFEEEFYATRIPVR
jgi:hypothetical protein